MLLSSWYQNFSRPTRTENEEKTASKGKKLGVRTLSLLLRLLLLGLLSLSLALNGWWTLARTLLRLDVLVIDSHGLVDLGNKSGLILEADTS